MPNSSTNALSRGVAATGRVWSRSESRRLRSRRDQQIAATPSSPLRDGTLALFWEKAPYLLTEDRDPPSVVAKKFERFQQWLSGQKFLSTTLNDVEAALSEILLRSIDDTDMSRGQIASLLRKVARPDLTIQIADRILASSRLNYYALATKGAALTDLEEYDSAIEILSQAIRPFHPAEGLDRPLNALSRTYRQRFKDTGEVDDLEASLLCAKAAWATNPNEFSARSLEAAAMESGDVDEVKEAKAAIEEAREAPGVSPDAALKAWEILTEWFASHTGSSSESRSPKLTTEDSGPPRTTKRLC